MIKERRILVLDSSRLVRATLNKHLKEAFSVREEATGESAWHTLVLDASVVAVIAGAQTPGVEDHYLLRRLRSSTLRRLNQLPVLLIASESVRQALAAQAEAEGISGWISKTLRKDDILAQLHASLGLDLPALCLGLPTIRRTEADLTGENPASRLLSREAIAERMTNAFSVPDGPTTALCALTFGIVNHDALIDRFGDEMGAEIGSRFASLLLTKIGAHDCIARLPGERLLIAARDVDLAQCANFARRVCRSLAAGQVTIRGEQVKLVVTAGAASSAEAGVGSAEDLLHLANQRLDRALACGGNAVVTTSQPDCPLHNAGRLLPTMIDLLKLHDEKVIVGQIGTLGLQLFPLLKALNQELGLGLQLAKLKQQLQQRAKVEQHGR